MHIDIEKPFWWDVPAWAVSGQVDSIGIANNTIRPITSHWEASEIAAEMKQFSADDIEAAIVWAGAKR